jgi:hypothetical protein
MNIFLNRFSYLKPFFILFPDKCQFLLFLMKVLLLENFTIKQVFFNLFLPPKKINLKFNLNFKNESRKRIV